MDLAEWANWSKHVEHVIATQGRWVGLGNGDGDPLYTLEIPEDIGLPDQWMETGEISLTLPAQTDEGAYSLPFQRLVVDEMQGYDGTGAAPVAEGDFTLLAAWRGKDGTTVRRGGNVVLTPADDTDDSGRFTSWTIEGLPHSDVWNTTFAVSWPISWYRARPYEVTTDESGIVYDEPRLMARIQLATRSLFTWKQGQAAFVIRRLAQESIDAMGFTQQDPDGTLWVDDPYTIVEVPNEPDTSPIISIDARDGTLWESCAKQAQNAGLILGYREWWPGDPPIRSWESAHSGMTPEQVDISPNSGTRYRKIVEQTFPHSMTVLTVTQVGG